MNEYNHDNTYPEIPLDPQLFTSEVGYLPTPVTPPMPASFSAVKYTFVPYEEEVVLKNPIVNEGYYINKHGIETKKKRKIHEFALRQAWIAEDELRLIRSHYDLIPSRAFLNPDVGTIKIKVATMEGQPVMMDCKNIRLSNAEYAALVALRADMGGFVPTRAIRMTGPSRTAKRAWVGQEDWDAANVIADARFVKSQQAAVEKALARHNGGK